MAPQASQLAATPKGRVRCLAVMCCVTAPEAGLTNTCVRRETRKHVQINNKGLGEGSLETKKARYARCPALQEIPGSSAPNRSALLAPPPSCTRSVTRTTTRALPYHSRRLLPSLSSFSSEPPPISGIASRDPPPFSLLLYPVEMLCSPSSVRILLEIDVAERP